MATDTDGWADTIHCGDSLDLLTDLPAESVHAAVTDPPYGLAFMGRDWDDFEPREYQQWCEGWAREVKRVLKPGGHLLAFSGNRTHHRLFAGVEDAGFEIRDTITWHYGSGFPKATDVSKTVDKRRGTDGERESVEVQHGNGIQPGHGNYVNNDESEWNEGGFDVTEAAHPDAQRWEGWKTGLKPATEYVVMARKPFDGATVDCVLEYGTGALNIDGGRVGPAEDTRRPTGDQSKTQEKYGHMDGGIEAGNDSKGRYPANVVFHEDEAGRLDEQVGELAAGAYTPQTPTGRNTSNAPTRNDPDERTQTDTGGPSRYFYTSKASKSERTMDGQIENAHPTVKPLDLMEWLVKLVTREGQTVLDPFAGSGTTCKAAKRLGRTFIGIEKQDRWADIARARCGLSPENPAHVRGDDAQQGIEQFTD